MKKHYTSYKKTILFILLLLVVLCNPWSIYAQCGNGNPLAKGNFITNGRGCAGTNEVQLQVQYANLNPGAEIVVEWGDTKSERLPYGTGPFNHTFKHVYEKRQGNCTYTIRIYVDKTCFARSETLQTVQNVVVWDTDYNNFSIRRPVVRVCQGVAADVNFVDGGPWNCFMESTTANRNIVARHLQYIYGRGPASNSLQGVTVGGVTPSPEIVGPVIQRTAPGQHPSATFRVPATRADGSNHQLGDQFFLTLNNWNQCNPYPSSPPEQAVARIVIVAAPAPAFERRKTSMNNSGDYENFCPNDIIYLKNLTPNPGWNEYTWTFINTDNNLVLDTKSGADVTHSFSTPGNYKAVLRVRDSDAVGNCEVTIEKPIKVIAAPEVAIAVENIEAATHEFCKEDRASPLALELKGTITSTNPSYSYKWDFYQRNSTSSTPDGTSNSSSTLQNLSYLTPGRYKIRLTATDNSTGCSNFTETTIKIYDRPDAAFNANTVCAGTRTSFTNISGVTAGIPTIVDGDKIDFWEWDFNNDGMVDLTRSDDSNFDYFIASPFGPTEPSTSIGGTYDVTLKVTTNKGCSHTITKQVEVKPVPAAAFTMNPASGEICNGQLVTFTNTTPSTPPVATYSWNFGPNATPQTASTATVAPVRFTNTTGADITYNIRLTVTTAGGCSNYYEMPVIIHPAPPVTITSDYDATKPNCSPLKPSFSHNADPATVDKYTWTVKELTGNTLVYDNTSSTNQEPFSPANIFVNNNLTNTDIKYEVQLTIKYLNGCEVISNKITVTVKPNPIADFTATSLSDCSPKKVSFVPNILDGTFYEWKFQNANIPEYTSTSPTVPEITFTNKTSGDKYYNVELTITSGSGCKSFVTKTIFVKPQPDPQFQIVGNRMLCSGESLEFKNTTPPGAPITKYVWVWGDGTPDTEVLPNATGSVFHKFVNNSADVTASYRVTLITIADCQAFSNPQTVLVEPKLTPEFDLSGANCSPAKISAQNKSKGPIDRINWFLDGVLHTSESDNVTFDIYNTSDVPTNHSITLKITSANGCDTTITKEITVQPEPKPSFTITPTLLVLPDNTVTIENTTPGDWVYAWTFGDGSPIDSTRSPGTHTFPGVGIYTVRLTISNGSCRESIAKEVTIYAKKPIADFAPDNVSGCKPVTVSFINKSQFADSTKYEWDFGDGKGKSTEVNPTYTYTEPGEYNVRLLARNSQNIADDTVKLAAVNVYDIPEARFMARPIYIELPDKPIYLTNQSFGADSYLWDFGDGTFSTESDPAHIYQDTGRYTIKLITFNKNGCSDTAIVENAVTAVWNGRVLIPNAFTPNLAGLGIGSSESNDYFFPVFKGAVSIDLKIFNRWGELMYRTTKLEDKGWNGYHNGKLCQQDVYLYTVKIVFQDGYQHSQSGDVVLVR